MSYLFAFSYCSWDSWGKNTEVVCHSLLQWTAFCQTSPSWPVHLGWPHTAWLSFTELDNAVVHVIGLASCLWLWFQSVWPLMPSLSDYRLTWVSLTLEVRYLFTASLAKHSRSSLPWMWGSSSRPCLCAIAYNAFNICINIWYLCFFFWLTSLCIIGSRFIHLVRTDSNVFLFIAE